MPGVLSLGTTDIWHGGREREGYFSVVGSRPVHYRMLRSVPDSLDASSAPNQL